MTTTQEILDESRLRANQESTGNQHFVEDDELLIYVNDAKMRLDSMLVRSKLIERSITKQTVTSVSLTLPSDYLFTKGVFLLSNDALLELYVSEKPGMVGSGIPSHYDVENGSFVFYPYELLNPDLQIQHHYVAAFPKLSLTPGAGLVTEISYPNRWESYIPISAAIDCLSKEEVVNPRLERKLKEIEEAIITEIDIN